MGKIIKNGIEYSSAVPNLTNILHTELDAYTADFDEKLATKSATYTSLEQLGLTADATVDDVYGALKDGETAILATSEFTNQLTMFPNFCTNDQYAILQVEKKNSNRAFIEWRQKEGNAYAIAGLNSNNQFTNWGNIVRFKKDGFADDSIVCIGDTVSNDGVIQTLANLGFTGDVMTWNTGVYRVSHVEGLTNLPTDITSAAPGFRLEHYDIKKWGGNHNPNISTWALRHSILYAENGNVYSRYTESGATAGVYTKDTGWRKIIVENSSSDPYSCTGYTVLTGTEDLFTLAPGHYATTKANMTYNYPITDSSNLTAHIYVLGCLNDPTNNKGYRIILYFDNKDRMYRINEWWGGFAHGWQNMKTKTTLVTNTSTLKLDITKKNAAWYGAIKLTYLYDTSPVELEIDFKSATDTLKWTVSKGQKYIKKITYTQDSANKAHYTIGIEFSGTAYGNYQAEVIGGFADINSLTEDAFTGDTTAVYGNPYGKNNGVTLVSAPEDLGLTSPCTTVQLVQAMRNTFNKTITSGAIGVFNNGGKTITDAPSDYGLLHIEVFGHDRVMIRYDGIGGSTYAGSWIGKVKGSNGTFSEITWDGISTGENIEPTTIDLSSLSGYSGTMYYMVKNGICYVYWNNLKFNNTGTYTLSSNLPKSAIPVREKTTFTDVLSNGLIGTMGIDANGTTLEYRVDMASKDSTGSFSYPVA